MADTLLEWQELENIVAAQVRSIYEELTTDTERRRFLTQLRTADRELLKLNRGEDVNYSLPRLGEAYALKYHLSRTDNICLALQRIYADWKPSGQLRILDVGSGTGCGAMALGYWATRNLDLAESGSLTVYCVEPSVPMRRIAFLVMRPFHDSLMNILGKVPGSSDAPYMWHPCRAITMEEATWLATTEQFDLILFSYTFSTQDSDAWRGTLRTVVEISKHLAPDGVLCFLTPAVDKKRQLMETVARSLDECGLTRKTIAVQGREYVAPERRPRAIVELRRFLNQESRRLRVENVYGENPQYDDPYYGFYGQLDIFERPNT